MTRASPRPGVGRRPGRDIRGVEFLGGHVAKAADHTPMPIRNSDLRPLVDGLDRDGPFGGLRNRCGSAGELDDFRNRLGAVGGGQNVFGGIGHGVWNLLEFNSGHKASEFHSENNSSSYAGRAESQRPERVSLTASPILWNHRLRDARKAKGYSVPELARRIVGSDDADAIAVMRERIYSYEKVTAKQKPVEQPRGQTMAQLASALDVSVQWLRDGGATHGNHKGPETNGGLDETAVPANVTGEHLEIKYSRSPLPIFGRAAGGREGKFVLNGEKVGEILRPPSLEAVPQAYCVEQSGDSMSPAIEDGYKLYVNPKLPYRRGHFVVVQIRTDVEGEFDGYAKKFVSFSKKELVLEQLNPAKQMRFASDLVESIHRIVGVEFN